MSMFFYTRIISTLLLGLTIAPSFAKPKSKNHKGKHLQRQHVAAQQQAQEDRIQLQKKQELIRTLSWTTPKQDFRNIIENGAFALLTNSMFAGTVYMYTHAPKASYDAAALLGVHGVIQGLGNMVMCAHIYGSTKRLIQRHKLSNE